jgi:hypothetical protein
MVSGRRPKGGGRRRCIHTPLPRHLAYDMQAISRTVDGPHRPQLTRRFSLRRMSLPPQVTALNEQTVDEGANMMVSLLLTNPNVPVLVYDIGLTVRLLPNLPKRHQLAGFRLCGCESLNVCYPFLKQFMPSRASYPLIDLADGSSRPKTDLSDGCVHGRWGRCNLCVCAARGASAHSDGLVQCRLAEHARCMGRPASS